MALSLGIIGLPNVGKSSLFSALTRNTVDISNYPFTTVDPNVGVVSVPDKRLVRVAEVAESAKQVPATVEFVDIAGLVKGANKGEGLGNQFLAHIREVDAIVEVLREFPSEEVVHIEGKPDPLRDHEIVETELLLKDLEIVDKHYEKVAKQTKTGEKGAVARKEIVRRIRDALRDGKPVRDLLEDHDDVAVEAEELALLTAKPILLVLNVSGTGERSVPLRDIRTVSIDVKEELDAADLSAEERKDLGLSKSALETLISEACALLGLITFFTANENEAHAWSVRQGTLLPHAVGVIHSDFQEQFIRADVIGWEQFCEAGGWAAARANGIVRSEGKDYVVSEGDVIEVKHSP